MRAVLAPGVLTGLMALAPACGATETVQAVPGAYATLAGCISTALSRAYPTKVSGVARSNAVEILVTEPRGGWRGMVHRGFERRLTVTVEKVTDRQAKVSFRAGDPPLPDVETEQAWSIVRRCGGAKAPPGRR